MATRLPRTRRPICWYPPLYLVLAVTAHDHSPFSLLPLVQTHASPPSGRDTRKPLFSVSYQIDYHL